MAGMKKCSFCGKPENKIQNMFSAGDANICDECVDVFSFVFFRRDQSDEPKGQGEDQQKYDSNKPKNSA